MPRRCLSTLHTVRAEGGGVEEKTCLLLSPICLHSSRRSEIASSAGIQDPSSDKLFNFIV